MILVNRGLGAGLPPVLACFKILPLLKHFRFLKIKPFQDKVRVKIPLNPPFSKGEVFLLPLKKGGREGFMNTFSNS